MDKDEFIAALVEDYGFDAADAAEFAEDVDIAALSHRTHNFQVIDREGKGGVFEKFVEVLEAKKVSAKNLLKWYKEDGEYLDNMLKSDDGMLLQDVRDEALHGGSTQVALKKALHAGVDVEAVQAAQDEGTAQRLGIAVDQEE